MTITKTPDGSQDYVEVSDRWRLPGLGILALLCAIAVVVVGGWQGVRALIALGLTAVVILKILLPLMIAGVPPVPLAVLDGERGHGRDDPHDRGLATIEPRGDPRHDRRPRASPACWPRSRRRMLGFTYTAGSDLAFLATPGGGGLDLRGILLAAILLGAVGVLDDVTVTQAVLVEELTGQGQLRGCGARPQRDDDRPLPYRCDRQHAVPRLRRGRAAVAHRPDGQCPAERRGPQRRTDRDRDRPHADRQRRDRHRDPAHDVHRGVTRRCGPFGGRPGSPRGRALASLSWSRSWSLLLLATSASSLLAPSRAPLADATPWPGSIGATGGPGSSVLARSTTPVSRSTRSGAVAGRVGAPDESARPGRVAAPSGDLPLVEPGHAVPITVDGERCRDRRRSRPEHRSRPQPRARSP